MRIIFFGTCSGTEPKQGFRHVSFAVIHNGKTFFFDAGEGSSYTAHLLGVDLLSTEAVFISHCHMDHIGGLPNLLWNIRKLDGISKTDPSPMSGKSIKLFIPNKDSLEGVLKILGGTEGGFRKHFSLEADSPRDGQIFDSGDFIVTALHNTHLERDESGRWMSFSYRIEAGDGSLVYSGDVRHVSELDPLLSSCSLLLMETGHHSVEEVCSYVKENCPGVEKLGFIHHGRAILSSPEAELEKAKSILGERVYIFRDKTAYDMQPAASVHERKNTQPRGFHHPGKLSHRQAHDVIV